MLSVTLTVYVVAAVTVAVGVALVFGVAPVDHEYVYGLVPTAALALKVTVLPLQILAADFDALAVGFVLTTTFVVLNAEQPLLSVTVTVYVIDVVGDTVAVAAVDVNPEGLETQA